jgi:MFS transporter, DHA2 family, multidrug resistance protein
MSDGGARQVLPRSAGGNRNPWLVAVVLSIATFMQVLDTSIRQRRPAAYYCRASAKVAMRSV